DTSGELFPNIPFDPAAQLVAPRDRRVVKQCVEGIRRHPNIALGKSKEHLLLVLKIVVQGGAAHLYRVSDVLHARVGIATWQEEFRRRIQQMLENEILSRAIGAIGGR